MFINIAFTIAYTNSPPNEIKISSCTSVNDLAKPTSPNHRATNSPSNPGKYSSPQ